MADSGDTFGTDSSPTLPRTRLGEWPQQGLGGFRHSSVGLEVAEMLGHHQARLSVLVLGDGPRQVSPSYPLTPKAWILEVSLQVPVRAVWSKAPQQVHLGTTDPEGLRARQGHLPPDAASQNRLPRLLQRMKSIAELD